MKSISVIGTRPQILKVDFKMEGQHKIIYTGQHYDEVMKDIFFKDMKIGGFDYELNATKLSTMINKLIKIFKKEKPSVVLVYGDCRSTLAGAIAAVECNIPIAHVEAGMRCYKKDMPEEQIRVIVDHLSTILFSPDMKAGENLEKEGIRDHVYPIGNTMFDTFNSLCPIARTDDYRKYSYLTIHRKENTDSKIRLENIFEGIEKSEEHFVFPCHPRTAQVIKKFKIKIPDIVSIIEPVSYRENLELIANAKKVLTDSGGVQNEAYWMNIPCGILRRETEWRGFVDDGRSILLNDDAIEIEMFMRNRLKHGEKRHMPIFGAKKKIQDILMEIYG